MIDLVIHNYSHVQCIISAFIPCVDVTRVLVLDESQGRALSQTVAKLLKDFGQLQATENFPVRVFIPFLN